MIYRGKVINGVVVLQDAARLPEGADVRVDIISDGQTALSATGLTWVEVFRDVVGQAQGLPADMARNHDHYLHGAPRR